MYSVWKYMHDYTKDTLLKYVLEIIKVSELITHTHGLVGFLFWMNIIL